jgi:hypothetical protein
MSRLKGKKLCNPLNQYMFKEAGAEKQFQLRTEKSEKKYKAEACFYVGSKFCFYPFLRIL